MHVVYTLEDPITREVRYVGVTGGPLEKRLYSHIRNALRGSKWHVSNWIRMLSRQRRTPLIIKQGEYEEREEALAAEIAYIKRLKNEGYRLTNLTKGGEGTWGWDSFMPKETCTRISLAHKRPPPKLSARKKRTP